jgi:serine/threonine protein kinase
VVGQWGVNRLDDKVEIEIEPGGLVGTSFDGKYEVLGEVARGGMGIVFRGSDRSLGRSVAIKILLKRFNTDAESVARFRREARAMASLDHQNIVPVYAIGKEFELHYFVMKFLTGWTVSERVKRIRLGLADPFSPEEVRQVLIQVCRGLDHAHLKGLIHRDIKPSNIMVGPDGHVTIMDFGIVKETADDTLTKTGIVFGTPDYMAPEHAQGQPPSAATDLYSLGIVAYEMLIGEQPFKGGTPFSLVLKHIKEPPPPLITRRDDIDPMFQEIIFKALAKKPEDRYPTAGAMMSALQGMNLGTPAVPATSESVSIVDQPGAASRASLPKSRPSIFDHSASGGSMNASQDGSTDDSLNSLEEEAPDLPSAILDDRPGHYRNLVTASEESGSTRRHRAVMYGVFTALGVGLIGLIIMALIR